ncbi:hypothetical protein DFH06DRAFT_1196004 [Mycena polygramma]|nr:hypothetical protein DFH06DRAFT_1196004 [Mycena polygramma]
MVRGLGGRCTAHARIRRRQYPCTRRATVVDRHRHWESGSGARAALAAARRHRMAWGAGCGSTAHAHVGGRLNARIRRATVAIDIGYWEVVSARIDAPVPRLGLAYGALQNDNDIYSLATDVGIEGNAGEQYGEGVRGVRNVGKTRRSVPAEGWYSGARTASALSSPASLPSSRLERHPPPRVKRGCEPDAGPRRGCGCGCGRDTQGEGYRWRSRSLRYLRHAQQHRLRLQLRGGKGIRWERREGTSSDGARTVNAWVFQVLGIVKAHHNYGATVTAPSILGGSTRAICRLFRQAAACTASSSCVDTGVWGRQNGSLVCHSRRPLDGWPPWNCARGQARAPAPAPRPKSPGGWQVPNLDLIRVAASASFPFAFFDAHHVCLPRTAPARHLHFDYLGSSTSSGSGAGGRVTKPEMAVPNQVK